MKFLRIGKANQEKPAIIDDQNVIRDLSSIIKDLDRENINFDTINKIKDVDLKKLPKIIFNCNLYIAFCRPSSIFAK